MLIRILICALFVSQAFADTPTSNNTFFTTPSNSTNSSLVWELGSTQLIQWNTTASTFSLDLYQYNSQTKNYQSAYIFEDYSNITEFAWEVEIIEPLDSTGQASFHLKLVPPNYNGLPDEGVNSIGFTIRNSTISNSSSSSGSSSTSSATKLSTASSTPTPISPSVSTTIYTSTTTTSTAPATSSSKISSSTRIGLGVGLGIGLTALILLNAVAIIWYVRRWRLGQQLKATPPSLDPTAQDVSHLAQHRPVEAIWEVDGNGTKAELSAWRDGRGVGELDGNWEAAELSAMRR